jgi:diguanylate cyclase (GGDEF)-like protein/PAS domain S-box-containing protein
LDHPPTGNLDYLQSKALDATANGIVIADVNGNIVWANPAVTQLTGYSLVELLGQNPRLLKSGKLGLEFYQEMWETILDGRVWHGDVINRRKDGSLYYEEMTITPVRSEDGTCITHFIAIKQDVTTRREVERKLQETIALQQETEARLLELTIRDSLTGLFNRSHFFELAQVEFDRADRYMNDLSVIMIDVDHFKHINDHYGHLNGDLVLETVARLARESLRNIDIIGRYGGDEFVALLPQTTIKGAFQAAERLRVRIVETPIPAQDQIINVTASLGVALYDVQCATLEQLFDRADQMLYQSKSSGRNRVSLWNGEVKA